MEWTDIITYVLGAVFATFGAKWGLKKIIMSGSKWAKALNPIAKEMDEALTAIGNAGADGELSGAEMKDIFVQSKDVWTAIAKVKSLVAEKKEGNGSG